MGGLEDNVAGLEGSVGGRGGTFGGLKRARGRFWFAVGGLGDGLE